MHFVGDVYMLFLYQYLFIKPSTGSAQRLKRDDFSNDFIRRSSKFSRRVGILGNALIHPMPGHQVTDRFDTTMQADFGCQPCSLATVMVRTC